MKSEIELKAIAFDKYMAACEHKDATLDMKVASMTLSAVLAAETAIAKKESH
tara:strand:- start:105 stop:260 length:156 start_codon:yes stop_codon:yes gene_type:complete